MKTKGRPPDESEELTRTIGPGVYLVRSGIPELEVNSGDHILVRDTHVALHRYLARETLETVSILETLAIIKARGDLTYVKDLTPRQTVWRPDGCYEMVGPFVGRLVP